MERINKLFKSAELETIMKAVETYRRILMEKMAELDQCQTHLKVNEALMQEVRFEKDKIRKELAACEIVYKKLSGEE